MLNLEAKFDRYPLMFGPTPIEKLVRLSEYLGDFPTEFSTLYRVFLFFGHGYLAARRDSFEHLYTIIFHVHDVDPALTI